MVEPEVDPVDSIFLPKFLYRISIFLLITKINAFSHGFIRERMMVVKSISIPESLDYNTISVPETAGQELIHSLDYKT